MCGCWGVRYVCRGACVYVGVGYRYVVIMYVCLYVDVCLYGECIYMWGCMYDVTVCYIQNIIHIDRY